MTIQTETYALDDRGRQVIPKDPDAVLDYSVDFTDWLALAADSFDMAHPPTAFAADGASITVSAVVIDGGVVTAFMSGGTVSNLEPVTFRTGRTVGGRTDDRTIYLNIVER